MTQLFDLKGARENGYTEDEILTHLTKRHEGIQGKPFDVEGAMKEGYTPSELNEYLASKPFPEKISTDTPYKPDWADKFPTLYKIFKIDKSIYKKTVKPLIELGAMTAGSVTGSSAGPAGTVAGGGLGYAMGKKVTDIIDKQILKLEGVKRRGKPISKELLGSLNDIKNGMMMEMGGQVVGKAIPKAVEIVTAPFSKRMTPEATAFRANAIKAGITPTPHDVVGTKSLGLVESLMEKIPGSADVIRDLRVKKQLEPLTRQLEQLYTENASKESIDTLGRKIWTQVDDYLRTEQRLKGDTLNRMRTIVLAKLGSPQSYTALGLEGKELLKAKSIAYNERANELYNAVGKFLGKKKFKTPELNRVAQQILNERKMLAAQDKTLLAHLKWASKSDAIPPETKAKVMELPSHVRKEIMSDLKKEFDLSRSWETLQSFRSEMGELAIMQDPTKAAIPGTKFTITKKGRDYIRLKAAVTKDMETAASEQGGKAWAKYIEANTFYGKSARIYKSKAIRRLIQADPEKVIDIAFRPGATTEIKMLKDAAGLNGFLKLRDGFTNKLLASGKKDIFDPNNFRLSLERYGDEMLEEVYGKKTVVQLKKIAQDGLNLGSQTPGQPFLKAITREYPDTVVDRIIGAPESKLQSHTLLKNIQIIKQAIKPKEFEALGNKLITKLMSLHQDTGLVKPQVFSKMVDKYNHRVLRRFFPYEKVEQLKNLANIARRIESAEKVAGNPSGTGQTLIAWGLFRMIMQRPVMGAVVAFTPKQLAKIYTSKFGMKWLTDGFKVPSGTKKAAELATKLTAIIATDEYEED